MVLNQMNLDGNFSPMCFALPSFTPFPQGCMVK